MFSPKGTEYIIGDKGTSMEVERNMYLSLIVHHLSTKWSVVLKSNSEWLTADHMLSK